MSIIYVDNAATTKISQNVLDAMMPYFTQNYGNASSLYSLGRCSKKAVENAREIIAKSFGASPREIYFTSCGTESDNWAVKSVAQKLKAKGKNHIITTNFEHHAILHTCQKLEKQGFEVTYLPVSSEGLITPKQVEDAITDKTAIVTIMYANNEIGTIQPIAEIGKICRSKGVLFHTDAVQAVGNVPINVEEQCIDLMSVSGHKIHAPKGIGFLYARKNIVLDSYIDGGAQERGKRAGTENVAYIVGLAKAVQDATANISKKAEYVTKLRDKLIKGILEIPNCRLNGSIEHRLCGNVNISFEAVEGESLLLLLDMNGICASSGSACTSGSLDPSHVLLAIGLPHEIAHGSLRLSLSEENTEEEVEIIIKTLKEIIERLRAMSPLWKK